MSCLVLLPGAWQTFCVPVPVVDLFSPSTRFRLTAELVLSVGVGGGAADALAEGHGVAEAQGRGGGDG